MGGRWLWTRHGGSGGFVLFGGEGGRNFGGDYLPIVLYFNFLAGFIYVLAGVGLLKRRLWCVWLGLALALATGG